MTLGRTELPEDDKLPVYREYLKKEQNKYKEANKTLSFMIKDTKHRRHYSMDFFNIKEAKSQLMEKETLTDVYGNVFGGGDNDFQRKRKINFED
jgi:hypothetical protein